MEALSLPESEVVIAMSKGSLDMLSVIPHEKIKDEGIKFVKGKIRDTCVAKSIRYSDVLRKRFWSYFRTTWLKTFTPSV